MGLLCSRCLNTKSEKRQLQNSNFHSRFDRRPIKYMHLCRKVRKFIEKINRPYILTSVGSSGQLHRFTTLVLHLYYIALFRVLYQSYMKYKNKIRYLANSKIYFSSNLSISFEFFSSAESDLNRFSIYFISHSDWLMRYRELHQFENPP